MKRIAALFMVLVFLVTCSLASAAEMWVVIKDKNGICRVIKSDHKTPKTIAGPFNTEKEADAAKAKECAKGQHEKTSPKKEPARK